MVDGDRSDLHDCCYEQKIGPRHDPGVDEVLPRERGFMSNPLIVRKGTFLSWVILLAMTAGSAEEAQPAVEKARPPQTSVASGEDLYLVYCAVCHGTNGKGGGPVTPELKDPVPDLTTLSKRHGGKYPAHYVKSVLRFGAGNLLAHGNQDMPIWGPIFRSMPTTDKITVSARITNLTHYLETLQVK